MKKQTKKVAKKVMSQSKIDRIYALTAKGKSQREIGKTLGISRSAVFYWIHK